MKVLSKVRASSKLKRAKHLSIAALLGTGLVFGTAAPASAIDDPVDIRVELDLPHQSEGPKIFEALGVSVGNGPELTADDYDADSHDYFGLVEVDIDPDAQTITITGSQQDDTGEVSEDGGSDFTTVDLRIATSEIASVSLVSDDLFEANAPNITPTIDVDSSGLEINWTHSMGDAYNITGSAVFSYELTPPPLILTATVGTVANECGIETEITVPQGTEVFWCYTATLSESEDFARGYQAVSDTVNGDLGRDLVHILDPGASINSVELGLESATVATDSVTSTGMWSAYGLDGDGRYAEVSATADATVNVEVPDDADELVEDDAEQTDKDDDQAPAAPVTATPAFTG